MRTGQLNKVINFEAQQKVPDGMGSFTTTWTVVAANVAAAIWPKSAMETMRAESVTMISTIRFRIRYRSVMRAAWRISWAGKYYNVVSFIDPQKDHRWMDIVCKEA